MIAEVIQFERNGYVTRHHLHKAQEAFISHKPVFKMCLWHKIKRKKIRVRTQWGMRNGTKKLNRKGDFVWFRQHYIIFLTKILFMICQRGVRSTAFTEIVSNFHCLLFQRRCQCFMSRKQPSFLFHWKKVIDKMEHSENQRNIYFQFQHWECQCYPTVFFPHSQRKPLDHSHFKQGAENK